MQPRCTSNPFPLRIWRVSKRQSLYSRSYILVAIVPTTPESTYTSTGPLVIHVTTWSGSLLYIYTSSLHTYIHIYIFHLPPIPLPLSHSLMARCIMWKHATITAYGIWDLGYISLVSYNSEFTSLIDWHVSAEMALPSHTHPYLAYSMIGLVGRLITIEIASRVLFFS